MINSQRCLINQKDGVINKDEKITKMINKQGKNSSP